MTPEILLIAGLPVVAASVARVIVQLARQQTQRARDEKQAALEQEQLRLAKHIFDSAVRHQVPETVFLPAVTEVALARRVESLSSAEWSEEREDPAEVADP